MVRNAVKAQERAIAPSSIRRSSEGTLSWACSSESKKRSKVQSKKESWEEENCGREEEEENVGIPSTTLGQSTSREHCSFGGY